MATCEAHGLATGPDGCCVMCRRAQHGEAPSRRGVVVGAAVGLVALVSAGGWLARGRRRWGSGAAAGAGGDAVEGRLATTNSAGRTGAFYLPADHAAAARAVVVAFHGTGSDGGSMLGALRSIAEQRKLIVVAPDSRRSPAGDFTWEVGDKPGERTEDLAHALACLAEVRAMNGVRIDDARVLAIGYSGGGSSAPYLATNDPSFAAFAVLHGGIVRGSLGPNPARGWLSTGDADPLRPPQLVQESVDYAKRAGLGDLVFRTFPGGHEITSEEIAGVIGWWLGA